MRRWQVLFILSFSCFLQASSHAATLEDIAVEYASRAGGNTGYALLCGLGGKSIQSYERSVTQFLNDRWKGVITLRSANAYNQAVQANSKDSTAPTLSFCQDVKTILLEATNNPSVILEPIEREHFIRIYHDTFASAKTSAQFDAFIHRYSNDDPENLVPRAIMRRDELSLRETEERRRRETEEATRREAQAKAEEELRKYEQDQRRQRMAKVGSFRRAIKVETETNCGPVLEIKGALVKIYSPVANYGNEHWIRKEQVFPPAYGCRFINGNYEPPSL